MSHRIPVGNRGKDALMLSASLMCCTAHKFVGVANLFCGCIDQAVLFALRSAVSPAAGCLSLPWLPLPGIGVALLAVQTRTEQAQVCGM